MNTPATTPHTHTYEVLEAFPGYAVTATTAAPSEPPALVPLSDMRELLGDCTGHPLRLIGGPADGRTIDWNRAAPDGVPLRVIVTGDGGSALYTCRHTPDHGWHYTPQPHTPTVHTPLTALQTAE